MSNFSSVIPTFNGQPLGSQPTTANSRPFMTPWLDYSTTAVPDNHELVMWWAQYLWLTDGNFRTAMERVAAHFMTVLEFPDLEPDEESTWKDLFLNEFNYRRELLSCAHDYLTYGNSFVTLYLPFRRSLRCQNCFLEQPIERVNFRLSFLSTPPYLRWGRSGAPCPRCGDHGDYEVIDRRDRDLSRVKINRFDPADIELAQNRYSLRKKFYWRIPEEARRDIQGLSRIHIEDTPIEVLEAYAVSGRLEFDDDVILHQDEPMISGVRTRGWGIPRSISCFRTAWLQQLTNKMDQAVAIDYTMGIRLLSPPAGGQNDPMETHGMEEFASRINSIVQYHRNNPTSYHTSPYPVQYQFLGGEGDKLLPPDKLKFRQQEYLSQLGVPLEYQQMSLQVQAAPMALRLFESYWQAIPSFYNRILDWQVKLISRVYGLEPTKVVMQKTTIADDMERKAVLLQLMSANQLSPQTALQPFGIDAHEEVKRTMRHQDYVARVQREFDEKEMQRQEMGALSGMTAQPTPSVLMQQQQMQQMQQMQGGAAGVALPPSGTPMGGIPMGGIPGQTGPSVISLSQMSEQAAMIAQQLYTMDDYSRKQELRALREGNKDLHALVIQNLDELRSQGRSQGEQLIRSQAAGGM